MLSKHDPIMDFSSPKYSNLEKQPSYANKDNNLPMEEDIVLEDSDVTQDILIVQDSTIAVNEKKEFIQDSKVEDVSMEEQALLVSSFEENNITKVCFEEISRKHDVSIKDVQYILDLSFISSDLIKIVKKKKLNLKRHELFLTMIKLIWFFQLFVKLSKLILKTLR